LRDGVKGSIDLVSRLVTSSYCEEALRQLRRLSIYDYFFIHKNPKAVDTEHYLFRYVRRKEADFIKNKNIIYSINPYGTYWTTMYTDDPMTAKCLLALDYEPEFRVGGIPIDAVPRKGIIYQGIVKPKKDPISGIILPGGAWEIVLKVPVFIIYMVDLTTKTKII
jgi:hypothetical protein